MSYTDIGRHMYLGNNIEVDPNIKKRAAYFDCSFS